MKFPSKSKKKRSKKQSFLMSTSYNHGTLLAVVLLFVAAGSFLIYKSLAASFNSYDEQVQYAGINLTRTTPTVSNPHPEPTLANAACLNTIARNWSKNMATTINPTTHTVGYFRHNPNFATQIYAACEYGSVAENIGAIGGGCTAPLTDNCSQTIYNAFVSPKEITDYINGKVTHYGNIISPYTNYVGVGAYRDDVGKLWVTHDFLQCTSCLFGSTTSVSPIAARGVNITAHAGQTIGYYHDIINLGPTETYSRHVDTYHYSSTGALIGNTMVDIGTSTTAKGGVYSWVMNVTIPTTARVGEKYCHLIWYNYAFGPGTSAANSNTSCVTVK